MADVDRPYVPAAGHDWALSFYDPIVALMGGNRTRKILIEQAAIRPGQRVLEIGCGTGTLVVLIKRLQPDAKVVGLDPDPNALARAQRKASRAGVDLTLDRGFSDALPYDAGSFDRVLSSFMFHHLSKPGQEATLREVRRVLKPGGSLHLVDFAMAESGRAGFFARILHAHQHVRDNSERRILTLMSQAGFRDARKVTEGKMLFGHAHVNYFSAI